MNNTKALDNNINNMSKYIFQDGGEAAQEQNFLSSYLDMLLQQQSLQNENMQGDFQEQDEDDSVSEYINSLTAIEDEAEGGNNFENNFQEYKTKLDEYFEEKMRSYDDKIQEASMYEDGWFDELLFNYYDTQNVSVGDTSLEDYVSANTPENYYNSNSEPSVLYNYGNIMDPRTGEFKKFGSYKEGRDALINQLVIYQTDRSKTGVRSDSTLLEAMEKYAPLGHGNNNPRKYAQFIADRMGVNINTKIKDIDTEAWADAIGIYEGRVPRSVITGGYNHSDIKVKSKNINLKEINDSLLDMVGRLSSMFPGIVVTSTGSDYKGHVKNSTHYDGDAVDIGMNSSNKDSYMKLKKYIPQLREQGFVVLDEGNHLHISNSPKGKK